MPLIKTVPTNEEKYKQLREEERKAKAAGAIGGAVTGAAAATGGLTTTGATKQPETPKAEEQSGTTANIVNNTKPTVATTPTTNLSKATEPKATPAEQAQTAALEEAYKAAQLPTYQAQTQQVNTAYDLAREAQLAALEGAYNKSKLEQEQAMAKIPASYQAAANQVSAEAMRAQRTEDEYAAAVGLNSGAGAQSRLARDIATQGSIGSIRTAEADAITNAQNQLALLHADYQMQVQAAIANNEYERAVALLDEYRTAASSAVSVAQAQADENYRAQTANISLNQYAEQQALNRAETMAAYGDFSGYADLGYSPEQIALMQNVYAASRQSSGGNDYYTVYDLLGAYGADTPAEALAVISTEYPKLSEEERQAVVNDYMALLGYGGEGDSKTAGSNYETAVNAVSQMSSRKERKELVTEFMQATDLTEQEKKDLANHFGFSSLAK